MNCLGYEDVVNILDCISKVMSQKESELCGMDAQMGDGDLGITMRKGWKAVAEAAHTLDESDIGRLLMKCGMKLSSAAPSTMGTLMASALMSGGQALMGKNTMDSAGLADYLQGFCDGIIKRGKCQPGDRTVLDSIWPAAQEARKHHEISIMSAEAVLLASREGLESTKKMEPKFGKAAVFASKADGVEDQGAVVGFLIVQCICQYIIKLLKG